MAYRGKELVGVIVFGITPPFHSVQDYTFAAGEPLTDTDVRAKRSVTVVGYDVADKLFDTPRQRIGSEDPRSAGPEFTIKGVIAKKGNVLGQSFDGFALLPLPAFESIYGRRKTTVVSVKMRGPPDAVEARWPRPRKRCGSRTSSDPDRRTTSPSTRRTR